MNLMVILYQDYVFLTIVEAVCKVKSQAYAWHFTWQGYMDEDRTFYSVSENAILGGGNV